jgi:hypothetical protein
MTPQVKKLSIYCACVALMLMPVRVIAQTAPRKASSPECSQGVIRLPNQAGTIQICSSVASRAPQLSAQLNDVTKRLGSQQQQLSELNRLIRGLNGVSIGITPELQEMFLKNFSAELDLVQKRSDDAMVQQFSALSERIEELQNQMVLYMSSPQKSGVLSEALKGDLGESISKFEFGSALRQLDEINRRLSDIETSVASVKDDTSIIREKVQKIEENDQKIAQQGEQSLTLLQAVARDFSALGNQGGLIINPSSIAEKYNNARILAQRGEVDRALPVYLEIMTGNLQFADVAADFVALLERNYGNDGALSYLEKKIKPKVPFSYYLYSKQILTNDTVGDEKLKLIYEAMKTDKQFARRFPPLAFKYLSKISKVGPSSDGVGGFDPGLTMESWLTILQLSDSLQDSTNSGSYRSFFIDQVRSSADVEGVSKIPTILLSNRSDLIKECTPAFEDWDFLGNACAAVGIFRKQIGDIPAGIVSFRSDRNKNLSSLLIEYGLIRQFIFLAKGQFSLELYQMSNGSPVARFNMGSVQPLVQGYNAVQSQKIIKDSLGILSYPISYPLGIPGNVGDFLVCFTTKHPVYNQPYQMHYVFEGGTPKKFGTSPSQESLCPKNDNLPLRQLKTIDLIEDRDSKIYRYLLELTDNELDNLNRIEIREDNEICEKIKQFYNDEEQIFSGLIRPCARNVSSAVFRILMNRKKVSKKSNVVYQMNKFDD